MLPKALEMGCKNPDFFHIGEDRFSKGGAVFNFLWLLCERIICKT